MKSPTVRSSRAFGELNHVRPHPPGVVTNCAPPPGRAVDAGCASPRPRAGFL